MFKDKKLADLKLIVEGKSKKIYEIEPGVCFMTFKPHLRSITYNREGNIAGTDIERMKACAYYMKMLKDHGIKTQAYSDDIVEIDGIPGMLVEKITTIPIEFICRYYASGSLVRLYPSLVKEGEKLKNPLYKYDLKQDLSVAGVDDPTLNESYIIGLELLTQEQFDEAREMLKKIGEVINKDFDSKGVKFIDMKMEFGFNSKGEIVLIDEISQDCMRANDKETNETITKDAYRKMKTDAEVLQIYKDFNTRMIK